MDQSGNFSKLFQTFPTFPDLDQELGLRTCGAKLWRRDARLSAPWHITRAHACTGAHMRRRSRYARYEIKAKPPSSIRAMAYTVRSGVEKAKSRNNATVELFATVAGLGGIGDTGSRSVPSTGQSSSPLDGNRLSAVPHNPCSTVPHVPRGTCKRAFAYRFCDGLFHVEHCVEHGDVFNPKALSKPIPTSPLYLSLGLGSHLGAGKDEFTRGCVLRFEPPARIPQSSILPASGNGYCVSQL